MIKDFRFKDIRKYLEEKNDTAILDAFDKLADVAIIFSPIMFGAQFLPLLDLLDAKDRLFYLGRTVVNFIAKQQEPDYIERSRQISLSYSLICYTAYFDSLAEILPKNVMRKLKMRHEKKRELSESAQQELAERFDADFDIHNDLPYTDHVMSFAETQDNLKDLYKIISGKIVKIIAETQVFSQNTKNDFESIEKLLCEEVPLQAIERFRAQYLYLADTYSDFGFFAQGVEFESLQFATKLNAEALNYIRSATQRIDIGLTNLYKIVNAISTDYAALQSQDIVNDLALKYRAAIEKPIIDNREISPPQEEIQLTFPKIVDAFIPQSYKCLSYDPKLRLENEKTWAEIPPCDDLDRFFVRYLCSPDSIDYPLVILGHPGSGKSLLTKVLTAQLMSQSYTAIRIPLREVNAESTIDLLVEDHIKSLTQRNLPQGGYADFAKQFKERPLLIILDGYDELLQAKGDIFASYLDKAMRFQRDQKEMNRPVRIIVTSRITLIDKAIVPKNSTVLRLMEFNPIQRNEWIKIWNNTNRNYFISHDPTIKPFALPRIGKGVGAKKNSILELAEQPLLLLMLALYDSEENSLSELDNDLKRTALYNNLLRRFVRRERGRYIPEFDVQAQNDQSRLIDFEMQRLGVVATGMYNREKLFIHTKELDNDLKFFSSGRNDDESTVKKLKDSESLLGSFFFIHQSSAKDTSANSDDSENTFEFLHNTFGEFLTADMILRYAIAEARQLKIYKDNYDDMKENYDDKLNTPDGLRREWFACMMFSPLYKRPVILEMIQEHAEQAMRERRISEEDFYLCFEIIVKNQLKMLLSTHEFPQVMMEQIGFANDIPLLGFVSIYTLNLIILASVLCKDGFVFDELEYSRHDVSPSETKPWELTYLWRTWFSTENLTGLSAIFTAKRDGNNIIIKCNDKFEASSFNQPIDIQLCVSHTFSDILNVGLAGLQSRRFSRVVKMNDDEIALMLKNENPDLYLSFLVGTMRNIMNTDGDEKQYKKLNHQIEGFVKETVGKSVNNDTILAFLEIIEVGANRSKLYIGTKRMLLEFVSSLVNDIHPNKEISEPIAIASFRLIQLLTQNDNIMFFDRQRKLGEPFLRYEFREFDRKGAFENLYRLSKRNYKENIFMFNQIKWGDSKSKLFDTYYIDSEDKHRIIKNTLSNISLEDFALSNPALLSRILLELMPPVEKNDRSILDKFVTLLTKGIKEYGLGLIGYDAVINTVNIVLETNNRKYIGLLQETMNEVVFSNRSPEYLGFLLYAYPEFFDSLLNLFSNVSNMQLTDMNREFYHFADGMFMGKRGYFTSAKSLLTYIKFIRKWFGSNEKHDEHTMDFANHMIDRAFFKSNEKIDMRNFTIEEIDNLMWFARTTNNEKLFFTIREFLLPWEQDFSLFDFRREDKQRR